MRLSACPPMESETPPGRHGFCLSLTRRPHGALMWSTAGSGPCAASHLRSAIRTRSVDHCRHNSSFGALQATARFCRCRLAGPADPKSDQFATAISQAEKRCGLWAMLEGERQAQPRRGITEMFEVDFSGRVLPFDPRATLMLGAKITLARRKQGKNAV